MVSIEQLVAKHTKEDAKASRLKWEEFSEEAFERQGSLAHKVIKKTHSEPIPVLEAGSVDLALVGQPALERVLADWLPLWSNPSRGGQEHPGLWSDVGEWALPPITVDDIKNAARKFPKTTGLGWDNFHPRLLLEVGDEILDRMAALLTSWERSPYCGELWTIIMVFLAKPEGGQRPIGLMPLLARIWSRIRQRECAKWERTLSQAPFWGTTAARGCDKAAWLHNVFVSHAKHAQEEAASFYVDLLKYYEHIGHAELKIAAQAWGFDLGLLRALCCTYVAPRRARIGACLSDAMVANGTVVAGCSCATALAKLVLLSALRAAAIAAPIARLLNVVDDVSAHVTGARSMVAQQLGATYRAFCAKVKEANLPISRHKTKALATSKELRLALMKQPGWDIGPDDFVDVHRDLGGDAISGSYRRVTTTVARERQARAQGRKLTRLFRPGLDRARVFRAGPTAKATWGSAIMGVRI